jgi:hypothetical protein
MAATPSPTLQAVSFEADQAALVPTDPDVVVVPIVAVHSAEVPWGKVVIQGVPVAAARRLPGLLGDLPAVLGPERVAVLADQARSASTPPLDPERSGRLSVLLLGSPSANGRCSPWSARAQQPGDRRARGI